MEGFMSQCEGIYEIGWIAGLGCRGLAGASGGLGKTPLPGHRYATLLRSGGYAAPGWGGDLWKLIFAIIPLLEVK